MPFRPALRNFLVALLVSCALLLIAASLLPIDRLKLGTQSYDAKTQGAARLRHRMIHWIAFGSLSFLLALLVSTFPKRLLSLFSAITLGAFQEWLQHIVYRNRLETWDIRDDSYAAFAGFAVIVIFLSVKSTVANRRTHPTIRSHQF